MDRTGLVVVIKDLYEAGDLNRRFLHARFVSTAPVLEEYRRLVRAAVFPDPFSQRPIRLRDGTATIAEYKRATGDLAGTVDLMLEFVEAGTEHGSGHSPWDHAEVVPSMRYRAARPMNRPNRRLQPSAAGQSMSRRG